MEINKEKPMSAVERNEKRDRIQIIWQQKN